MELCARAQLITQHVDAEQLKHSDSMATNRTWPYKGHTQLNTRQASPQCI